MRDLGLDDAALSSMGARAAGAAVMMKCLSHPQRLMILCHLVDGERSVSALCAALDLPQATVSQQLARLRAEGLVRSRRDGKAVYYCIRDEKPRRIIGLLYELYCGDGAG